jgi:hypothetical protein
MSKPKYDAVEILGRVGMSRDDAKALRRISMTLTRWFEHECNGNIQRDEATGKPFWYSENTGKRVCAVADREAGAMKRLKAILTRYPALSYYVQGDPRGCSVYIIRPGDVPEGQPVDAWYSRGIAVY